ncbi:MAG: hypothetical protein FJ109_08395, partial [Deltaproteobacteria bacterium]|nr:hypothetical protein [Deltaproteobacteria bacterium]
MRFTILSATIPLSRELRDSLREIHARFLEALANRVRAPGPERLARLVRRLVETASSQESEGAGGPAAGQRDAAPASGANSRELLAARAHFFLATDVAKLWLPGLEAAAACDLPSRRELSVLDLHAGLGTATAGIMLLLAASGYKGRVRSVLTEHDPASAGIA